MFSLSPARKYLRILDKVEELNSDLVNLTANQNVISDLAMRFYRSPMGMRYDFGRGKDGVVAVDFFGNFSAITYPDLHDILDEATNKAKTMLCAADVNLQALSGAHAMLCALVGSTKPGDTIMSVREEDGGHFCTKKIVEIIGRRHVFAQYDLKSQTFDVDQTARIFRDSHARVLYLDTSVLLRPHPLKNLRSALPKEAFVIYDASHTLGLIMGGEFQSPLKEGADMISANTHKTFPGPHRGLLAYRTKEIAERINSVITNTLYSTVHTNSLMALAISIIEMDAYGKSYAKQIINNSNALGEALEMQGFSMRHIESQYTNNHQVHMFFEAKSSDIVRRFYDNGISISTSDALGGKSFIRFGTQEVTKRGMKEKDMIEIARFARLIMDGKNIPHEVHAFNRQFSQIRYAFPYSKDF